MILPSCDTVTASLGVCLVRPGQWRGVVSSAFPLPHSERISDGIVPLSAKCIVQEALRFCVLFYGARESTGVLHLQGQTRVVLVDAEQYRPQEKE